jgi:hypothetical protein
MGGVAANHRFSSRVVRNPMWLLRVDGVWASAALICADSIVPRNKIYHVSTPIRGR